MFRSLHTFKVVGLGITICFLTTSTGTGCTSTKKQQNTPTQQPTTAPADGSALNVMAEDDTRHVEMKLEQQAESQPEPARPTRIDYRRGRGVVDQPQMNRP
ncbi:MAG: hypothetical protein AB7N71_04480 [Phycisphaerae bacterium]